MLVLQSVNNFIDFKTDVNDLDRRLDRVIRIILPESGLGEIYSAIRKGSIRINGRKSSQSYRIREGDVININPALAENAAAGNARKAAVPGKKQDAASLQLEKMLVFRNAHLAAFNKPAGMLVHGEDSLADLLLAGSQGIADNSLSFKPAPLHRLDRNTSGLIFTSMSLEGAREFSRTLREGGLGKYYLGICKGNLKKEVRLNNRLERSGLKTSEARSGTVLEAETFAYPLASSGGLSAVLFRITTGKTHQIRSQASIAGFPLAGDLKYGGGRSDAPGYLLHSFAVVPPEKNTVFDFPLVSAPPPSRMMKALGSICGLDAGEKLLPELLEKILRGEYIKNHE